MPIMMKRKNGEVTPYRNSEFIPAYYSIPKSILQKCGTELNELPRTPYLMKIDWDAIATVESDLFRLLIIDAYAYMVWPHMGLGPKMEIFSGYEPAWIFAHSPGFWIQEMLDEKIIPTANELLSKAQPFERFDYVSEDEISGLFSELVPKVMEKHNMKAVIDAAKDYRCFEDFDYRASRQKTDFYREWYHTRTKHPMISLDAYKEDYAESHGGQEWDIPDESCDVALDTTAKVQVDDFLATLAKKDKQILQMRMDGHNLQDIAYKLGYQNHSGVLKRIRKIGKQYEKYSGEDFGFNEQKIVDKVI